MIKNYCWPSVEDWIAGFYSTYYIKTTSPFLYSFSLLKGVISSITPKPYDAASSCITIPLVVVCSGIQRLTRAYPFVGVKTLPDGSRPKCNIKHTVYVGILGEKPPH